MMNQKGKWEVFKEKYKNINTLTVLDINSLRKELNQIREINTESKETSEMLLWLGELYASQAGEKFLSALFKEKMNNSPQFNIRIQNEFYSYMILRCFEESIRLKNPIASQKYIEYCMNKMNENELKNNYEKINIVHSELPKEIQEYYQEFINRINDKFDAKESNSIGKIIEKHGQINPLYIDYSFITDELNETGQEIFSNESRRLEEFYKNFNETIENYESSYKEVDDVFSYSDYDDAFYQNVADKNYNSIISEKINVLKRIEPSPYLRHFVIIRDTKPTDYLFGRELCSLKNGIKVYSWTSDLYDTLVYNKESLNDNQIVDKEIDIKIVNKKLEKADILFNRNKIMKQTVDDLLLNSIKENHDSEELKNIIRTITYEQNTILRIAYDKNFIFDGCAGSGKTQILFHRLKFLANNRYFSDENMLVITPNKAFDKMVASLREDLNILGINTMTMINVYSHILNEYTKNKKNIGKWSLLIRGKKVDEKGATIEPITFLSDDYLDSEIANYYYSDDFKNKVMNLEKIKIHPINSERINHKQQNGKVDIMRLLLGQKELNLLPEYNRKSNIIHKCEMYALVLFFFARCKDNVYTSESYSKDKKINFDYSIFFIDEVQDYNKNELLLLNNIKDFKKFFNVFGDLNQRVNDYGLNDWDDLKLIGEFTRYNINYNYRNTKEIVSFVNENCNKDMKSVGLSGGQVEVYSINDLKKILDSNKSITVIAKNKINYPILYEVKNVTYNISSSKGLEFPEVLVINDALNSNERYVAYTRATKKLYVIK